MSNREADAAAGFERLESSVRRLVDEMHGLRRAVAEAQERARRSDALLQDFSDGRQDPAALARRVAEMERENEDLRDRVKRGRRRIDQILASVRFLEERR